MARLSGNAGWLRIVAPLVVATGIGALPAPASAQWWGKKKDEPKKVTTVKAKATSDYEMVGDSCGIDGMSSVKVEGVGLVIGLKNTGSDPPPNRYREIILDEMKKMEIYKPKELLASDTTCIVLLRAWIPPGCRKGDTIDVEVFIPPGDPATSIKGGRLLEAKLRETAVGVSKNGSGRQLTGKEWLKVAGPVIVAANSSDKKDEASLRKGSILGQGRVLDERNFRLAVTRDVRSVQRIKAMTHRINQRFFSIAAQDGHRVRWWWEHPQG